MRVRRTPESARTWLPHSALIPRHPWDDGRAVFERTPERKAVLAATLVALVGLILAAIPASAATASCEYTGSNHKLKITISGTGVRTLSRAPNGNIFIDAGWCGRATVSNTDRIVVLAGAGSQFLT